MRGLLETFEVTGNRLLAAGAASSVTELTLTGTASVEPGDMLYVWWQNEPALVDALAAAVSTEPLASWQSAGTRTLSLQVTMRDGWPLRSAAYLHRLEPGTLVRAWVMPHPHRAPRTGPGLAVVTGSGASGVFAALRDGARGIDLIWALGDKEPQPWVLDELRAHERAGSLASAQLLRSPQRVGGALAETLSRTGFSFDRSWVYVSGNTGAGEAAHRVLAEVLGEPAVTEAAASVRYVNSS